MTDPYEPDPSDPLDPGALKAVSGLMFALNRMLGTHRAFELAETGVKVSGTFTAYDLRQNGPEGEVWVKFAECEDYYHVRDFAETTALPGTPRQIEQEGTTD